MEVAENRVWRPARYFLLTCFPKLPGQIRSGGRGVTCWIRFGGVAGANFLKLSGLKLHAFICSSEDPKTETGFLGLKSRCPQDCLPSGGFRGQSLSSPFPGPGSHSRSLAPGPFSSFEPPTLHLCEHPSIDTSPSTLLFCLPLLLLGALVIIWTNPQDNPGKCPQCRVS